MSNELLERGVRVSPFGVRCIWLRHELATMKHRLEAPEAKMAQARPILTESQLAALEKAKADKEAHGAFESGCPGCCGAQDTLRVGTLKGVGRVHQQTFIDTDARIGFAEPYDRRTPLTAADLRNDRVIPFHDEHGVVLQRVPTDRGTEYCGTHDRHEYELYLAVENIDHGRTRTKSPRTTDEVEHPLCALCLLFFVGPQATARRRAGQEVKARPCSFKVAPPLRHLWVPAVRVGSIPRSVVGRRFRPVRLGAAPQPVRG